MASNTHTHTVHTVEIMRRKTLCSRSKVAYALQSIDHRELKADRQTNKQRDGAESDNRLSTLFCGVVSWLLGMRSNSTINAKKVSARKIFDQKEAKKKESARLIH